MKHFEGRRLSWTRLGIVLGVAALAVLGGRSSVLWFQDTQAAAAEDAWFAGYVDVTATPAFAFEDATEESRRHAVLSFVVADPAESCEPSWGAAYTLDEAASSLDLDRRIARLRRAGGDVSVSFGGAINDELATVCDRPDDLERAYREVVDRYDLSMIDLDIEGPTLDDDAATTRRAEAIAGLQESREEPLDVWLTLPVATTGLTEAGSEQVRILRTAGVDLAGVNLMTMNYGPDEVGDDSMADASTRALRAAHEQLLTIYDETGEAVGPATMWRTMGATAMIGQNDVQGQIFGLEDAVDLQTFALEVGLGRLSMWSLNRDRACSANYADVRVVSTSCSGVEQEEGAFADLLYDATGPLEVPETEETEQPVSGEVDDPDTSPYPIWDESEAYAEGDRVVWHRNVYEARWWTSDDVPDDPTVAAVDAPWDLIGPVLPGETPRVRPTLPAGSLPLWEAEKVYTEGDRVMLDDAGFEAQWWTRGDQPSTRTSNGAPSPWKRLTDEQVREIVDDR